MFRILTLAATMFAVLAYRGSRRARRADRAPALPHPLQTWEGEGGGVPASATKTVAQLPVPAGKGGATGTMH